MRGFVGQRGVVVVYWVRGDRLYCCVKCSWHVRFAVLMCQWFAPTKLRITFETRGPGKFSQEEMRRVVVKNIQDQIVSLNLPTKFVLIANHQVSAYHKCLLESYWITQGLRRLVVCLVPSLFHWSDRRTPTHVHHTQEELTMGANRGLGKSPNHILTGRFSQWQTGHAILQFYLSGKIMGCW